MSKRNHDGDEKLLIWGLILTFTGIASGIGITLLVIYGIKKAVNSKRFFDNINNVEEKINYKFSKEVNEKKVYEQNLSEDARLLIDIMYIKYLASEEERNYYFTKLLEDKKLDEQQFLNKNIFDKKIEDDFEIQKKDEKNDVDLSIIDSNITWYDKLLDKIKNFFNK